MKERPILFSGEMVRAILDGRKTQTRRVIKPQGEPYTIEDVDVLKCPYGIPGDRLWVRETFADLRGMGFGHKWAYRADTPEGSESDRIRIGYGVRWKPSIHMPRWASRITLEITDIRVERVQDITYIDAKAEGVEYEKGYTDPREAFATLWNSINAKRDYGWAMNPWVWIIEFKGEAV